MDIGTTGLHQVVAREAGVIDVVKHQSSFSVVPKEMKVFEAKPSLNISNNLFVLRGQHVLPGQFKYIRMENTHGGACVRVFARLSFFFSADFSATCRKYTGATPYDVSVETDR